MQERWRQRLAESEAAAAAKLGRERELVAQYEGTITELSQDVASLTRDVQRLRDQRSSLQSEAEALKGDLENQQVCAKSLMHALRLHTHAPLVRASVLEVG